MQNTFCIVYKMYEVYIMYTIQNVSNIHIVFCIHFVYYTECFLHTLCIPYIMYKKYIIYVLKTYFCILSIKNLVSGIKVCIMTEYERMGNGGTHYC